MEKKFYDFIDVQKVGENTRAVVSGLVLKGKTKEAEVNGKKVLNLVLKVNGKVQLKFDMANKKYDKEKNYSDVTFIKITCWDEKKFSILKNSQNIILAGNISNVDYNGSEYLNMSFGEYDSLKVLKFREKEEIPEAPNMDYAEEDDPMPF